MSIETAVTAAVLVIGDEILSGRTKDKNIGFIADTLTGIGIDLKEVRIVPDEESAIVEALNALRTRYTYLFTTGGIGPTHDDITVDCVGKALGRPVIVDPRARDLMQAACEARGVELTPVRLRMARMPTGAELIETPASVAPGFWIENVIVMAGIPDLMQAMLKAATHRLKTGTRINSVSITVAHPESRIAELFEAHQKRYPDVAMGSYPALIDGHYRTELVLRSRRPEVLERARSELTSALSKLGLLEQRQV